MVTISGWLAAWLIYGRKPLTVPVDPLVKALGSVHTLLRNKYYFDELYMYFVNLTVSLAKACAIFDRKIIDGLVNVVGRFGRRLSSWLTSAIDNPIVDGAVNGVGWITAQAGEFMRATQTGKVQNYLLVAAVTVVLLLALFLVRS